MLRESEPEPGEVILSSARILHIQPIELWGSQPILRQALLTPEKIEDKSETLSMEGSPQKVRSFGPTDFIDVHFYPAVGGGGEPSLLDYSTLDLLSGLTVGGGGGTGGVSSSPLPALTSSQLSCLLAELPAAQSQSRTVSISLESKKPGVQKEVRMEERTYNGRRYFACLRCDFICLSPERVVSHHCPGPPRKVNCLACPNTFKSTAVLKAHLLIDHGVSVEEHPSFIVMNLGEQHLSQKSSATPRSNPGEIGLKSLVLPSEGEGGGSELQTMQPGGGPLHSADQALASSTTGEQRHAAPGGSASNRELQSSGEVLPPPPGFSLFASVETLLVDDGVSKVEKEKREECSQKELGPEDSNGSDTKPIKLEKSTKLRCSWAGCTVKLSQQPNLEYHLLCHENGGGGGGWKCPECGSRDWASWSGLSVHLWRSHRIDMELYSCDLCDYKTNSMSKLMNLHRRTHGDDRPFLCDCGKGFKTPKQLRNHKHMVHRRNKKKPVAAGPGANGGDGAVTNSSNSSSLKRSENLCGSCGRGFSSSRRLQRHTDFVHRGLKPYLCPECGHAAASKSALKLHLRQHTGEKPYACEECDFCTSDHNTLRKHKMRHTGERQYSCPYCPYACIQTSTYKLHLKNKHPGINDGLLFACELCPFKTIKRDNFLAHTSTHPPLQPNQHPEEDRRSKPVASKNISRKTISFPSYTD